MKSEPIIGKRHFSLSGSIITDEIIDSYPFPFIVDRYGASAEKKIALTFDDGPNNIFTPQILDILKKENVLGTFFVIGENSEKYPTLIQRMYDE